MKISIDVTQQHIDTGKRHLHSPYKCIIARAFKEACGETVFVGVTMFSFGETLHALPQVVRDFIAAANRRDPVAPFAFEVDV